MPATKTRRAATRSKRRKPARKRASRPARGASSEPTALARGRAAASRQLSGHRSDAAAVGLVVVGVLCALGLWTDLAGPVGDALADGLGALVGRARVAVPVACIAFAVVLLWPHRRRVVDESGEVAEVAEEPERPTIRVALGVLLLLIADVGILHLASGRPPLDGALDDLRSAGGVLGALVAEPLAAATGVVGAAVILGALALLGLLFVLGVSIRAVGGAVAIGARRAGAFARAGLGLADVGGPSAGDHDPVDAEAADAPEAARVESAPDPEPEPERVPLLDDLDDDAEIALATITESDGQISIDLGDDARARVGDWKLPAPTLLKRGSGGHADHRLAEEGGRVLEATLAQHGVDARLIGMTVGPTVTQYALDLGPGVKVNRVTGLSHDIQYAMASPDVRILAPIPGRSAIGVEVPNRQRELVTLGDVLAAPEAQQPLPTLAVGLGRDIQGKSVMLDLSTLPHVLIAGATGAGKSSCINSLVTSLLMRCTPDQVRLILVDPKRVELGAYNDLPHLLTQVVTNPKKAANALDWAVREMDLRYELLAEVGVRDITGYNAAYDRGELPTKDEPDPVTGRGYERLPFIVIVVDELNDLMMVAARDVEASICRIAQMARAVGIHLVIATQRPSVDVITGVIKANVPSRLAFSVSSLADSRVILDQAGAEKLIGQGDMLLLTASSSRAQRIQGSWVDEDCVHKVVAHWRRQMAKPEYVEGLAGDEAAGGGSVDDGSPDTDELLDEAMDLVVRGGLGSTSMLQRKLRVGFARAGRLMDLLERRGVVGPSEGSKARAVLMTVEELDEVRAASS
ncbi:MAG TPA: DNA translocase FtsK [Acidimicrobiia bacterium]|jgi:S-DNA-T family DNA segregation ATPase FtsK/SpoIIIE